MTTERKTASAGLSFFRAILVFCLFAVIVLVWFRISPRAETYDQKRAAVRIKLLKELRADDEKKLNTYAWVDQKKQLVQIPIDHAMEIVMGELAAKKAAPSAVKVEIPYPAGLQQQPAPAAAPAASPSAVPAATPKVKTMSAPAA